MFKKFYTGLMLIAGVAIVSVVISLIFEKDEDGDKECNCEDCCEG